MMKKALLILTLSAVFLNPANVFACRYENISVDSDGTVRGRWIPCNDENCPDYQQHFQRLKNENVVYEHDISKDEPAKDKTSQNDKQGAAGKVYDKKQHRERDVEAVSAEREAIDKVTGEVEVKEQEEKKEPVEKKVIKEIGKIFGF